MKTTRHKYNNLHNVMVDAMRRAEPLRTFLVLSLLLLLVGSMSAQSAGWNYVMTVCPLEGSVSEPSTDADMSRVTIEYLDDLGRKISTVNVGASYAVQDMADYITYDGRGRVSRRYLPFETPSSTGSFPQSAVSTAQAYHGDLYCFSETTYDGTADSRVASVTGPGQAWHATGKSVKTRHLFNNATGEGPHACVIFQAQGDSLDIYLTYRADGVKRLEQTRRRYIKVITRVDGEGNVTTVNRPMTENHVRRYYGSMVTETGRDRRIYNEVGYIDVHNNGDSVSYHYYERDYLGSVRLVVNECGDIEQATDYCVGGLPSTRLATGNVDRRHHTSKEMLTFHGVSLYDNQARWYDPILCCFTTPDPLAEQYPDLSPYSHCANNPLTIVDPSGMVPIYNQDGYLLGTDDNGLQGNAIIMDSQHFKQGMPYDEAMKHSLGIEGLIDDKATTRFYESYNSLSDRPDWDGHITLEEANDWYNNGLGKSLYVDINKIDLSNVKYPGEDKIGDSFSVNLQTSLSNDGLVFGTITFKVYPNSSVRAFSDTYDFDYKPNNSLKHVIRNVATFFGSIYAGEGKPYDINIYGTKKIE